MNSEQLCEFMSANLRKLYDAWPDHIENMRFENTPTISKRSIRDWIRNWEEIACPSAAEINKNIARNARNQMKVANKCWKVIKKGDALDVRDFENPGEEIIITFRSMARS